MAHAFHMSRETVFRSVERAVQCGRVHQVLPGVTGIGIDEIAWQCGHRHLALVYQIDEGAGSGCGSVRSGG